MDKSFVISSVRLRDSKKEIEVSQSTILSAAPLFIPKEPMNDEYSLYCKVEEHMDLSIDIHYVHKQTQSVLSSLLKAKPSLAKSNIIYNALRDVTNQLNFAALVNELDEALFNDCGTIDTFWVQDKEYKLESLYYKQESWSDDVSLQNIQPFKFNEEPHITLDEGMFLIMICDKWFKCLQTALTISDSMKLSVNVNRFHKKIENCMDSIVDQMSMYCNDDEQLIVINQLKDTIKNAKKN